MLRGLAMALVIGAVLTGGFVLWYMHSAKPARAFCESIAVGVPEVGVSSRAAELGFDRKERSGAAPGERVFIFSVRPNGESRCVVSVKNGKVIGKQHVLYL